MTAPLPRPVSGRPFLLLGLLLLPVACLAWTWSALPAQVPVHFTRGGADQYAGKYLCLALVWLPALIYAVVRWVFPPVATAPEAAGRRLLIGGLLLASAGLCIWLVRVSQPAG